MHLEEEIVTNSLSLEQLQASIPKVARFFEAMDRKRISVEYGWGCNLPTDQLWTPMQMEPLQLEEFIEKSQRDGPFRLGSSDLVVQDLEGSISFTICHESDLQFVSSDNRLLEQVATMWSRKGFTIYIGPHSIEGSREWRRVDAPDQGPPTRQ